MPSLSERLLKSLGLQRAFNPFTPAEWAAINGGGLAVFPRTTMNNKQEEIGNGFTSLATYAYANNPVVFACVNARVQLFSEARFQYQELRKGRPGNLYSTEALGILETPYVNGTTGDLLVDMELDGSLAGNSFTVNLGGTLQRLRPDWTVIIAGNPGTDATTWDLGTDVLGYGYQPDGPQGGKPWIYLQASEVAHYRPVRDPLRRFSGMPWLLSVLRDVQSDGAATSHKQMYWENAATPNMAIKFDPMMDLQKARQWIDLFKRDHEGAANAYKTLFLGGGADTTTVGDNMTKSNFTDVQGKGELRIASAAGVPPIIVGLAGGLDAATYSNYGQARRAFADLTIRPLWRRAAGALQTIIPTPAGSRLWFDDRDISFLQEDVKDWAEIQSKQAVAIRQLTDAGFDAATIVDAVTANDFSRLEHTGLFSVQLQPPGTTAAPSTPAEAAQPPMLMNGAERSEVRCPSCNRLAAVRTAPGGGFEIKCRGCSALVAA